jgi:hypothetical protein
LKFGDFQDYVEDTLNDFHLSPIEDFMRHFDKPKRYTFDKFKKYLASEKDCFTLDVNLQSPIYTEYIDNENLENLGVEIGDYESFEGMLEEMAESEALPS